MGGADRKEQLQLGTAKSDNGVGLRESARQQQVNAIRQVLRVCLHAKPGVLGLCKVHHDFDVLPKRRRIHKLLPTYHGIAVDRIPRVLHVEQGPQRNNPHALDTWVKDPRCECRNQTGIRFRIDASTSLRTAVHGRPFLQFCIFAGDKKFESPL